MADLNDFTYTDGVHDVLAAYINSLVAGNLRGELTNVESLAADKALNDADFPSQFLDPDGSDRVVTTPEADAGNHLFFFAHTGSANTITVKNSDSSVTLGVLSAGQVMLAVSGGATGDYAAIKTEAVADYLLKSGLSEWDEQGSNPSTPAANKWKLYFKTNGLFYIKDTGEVFGVSNVDGWNSDTNTWSYSSADSPTFVISVNADMTGIIGVGMRIKLTQTTVKYFIVTAVGAYSGGATLVTVYGGTDYTLANAAITSPYYSSIKAPFGFPTDPDKWSVTYTNTTAYTQATPTNGAWYNLGGRSLSVPIGVWDVKFLCHVFAAASSGRIDISAALSSSSSSVSDLSMLWTGSAQPATLAIGTGNGDSRIAVTSKTTYYLIQSVANATSPTSLGSDATATGVRAYVKLISAYL